MSCLPTLSGRAENSSWKGVQNWGYQLQNLKLDKLAASPFDLLVIDYSRDGSDAERFSQKDIIRLKSGQKGSRLVLAYLSIGEAESYRYYWKKEWKNKNPRWLDRENPDWKENYKVRYWEREWQGIIFRYLDRIIEAGFDGVYLDIIDAYEYYEEKGRESAADDMKRFVRNIAHYARKIKGRENFGIFPQNGEELLADPAYLKLITGIGKEDTYYGYDEENQKSPADATAGTEKYLDMAVKAGKLVLNVDYVTDTKKMAKAYTRSAGRGYIEYCATRELDRLVPQPWFSKDSK